MTKKTTHVRVYLSTHSKVTKLSQLLGESVPSVIAKVFDELASRLPDKAKPKGEFILTELFNNEMKGKKNE